MVAAGTAEVLDGFAAERPRLVGLAYRMLGSRHDAEDVMQEAWLRWDRTDRTAIERPAAWLTTVVSRLALDLLRARQRDRADYVGPWLPEPIVLADDAAVTVERRDSLRLGFLHLLERLTPRERVAYVLAEVFDEPHAVVGAVLGETAVNSRQLVSRARRKLAAADVPGTPGTSPADRYGVGPGSDAARDAARRFLVALATGDIAAALAAVAPDVVMVSDGGAHVHAARRPVCGAANVVRLNATLARRLPADEAIEPALLNGEPAIVVRRPDRSVRLVMVFAVADDRIVRIRSVVNPDKLTAIDQPLLVA